MREKFATYGHVIRRMRRGCKRIVNGILWEMSELITQERIAVRILKLDRWIDHVTRHIWPMTKAKRKVSRSRGHVTYQQQ